MDKFFQRDLLTLLNKWYKLFYDFQRTVRLVMRYCIALVQYVGDWSNMFFGWLDGHFRNMAMGQVTVVTSEGLSRLLLRDCRCHHHSGEFP